MTDIDKIQNIAARVLRGTATEEERLQMQQYFSETGTEGLPEFLFPESGTEHVSLLLDDQEKRDMLNVIKGKTEAAAVRSGTARIYNIYRRRIFYAAACLMVMLLSGVAAYVMLDRSGSSSTRYVSVTTAYGRQKTIWLSDGTRVSVNAGSRLRYPVAYSDTMREVFLEGEAFFEVAKDGRRPFVVHAGNMNTRVLGTSFNIRAYAEECVKRVQVKTGKVRVALDQPAAGNRFPGIIVIPGKQIKYNMADGSGLVEQAVGNGDIASWINHKLIFNDQPLSEILRELERVYDVHFRIPASEELTRRYTIRFDRMPIAQAIETIHLLTSLDFEMHSSFITVNSKKDMKKN